MSSAALVCLFLFGAAALAAPSTPTDFSLQFDLVAGLLKMGMAEEKSHELKLPDFHGAEAEATGVVLTDTVTFKRMGTVYMVEPKVDYMTVYGGLGFGTLKLNITNLRMDGKSTAAMLTAGSNQIDFSYTLEHKSKRNCVTRWTKFTLEPLGKVVLDSPQAGITGEDITEYFNAKILPDINKQMASPKFLGAMRREYDFCISRFFPI